MNYNTSDRTITVYLVFFVRGTRNLGRRIKLLIFFICVIFFKGEGGRILHNGETILNYHACNITYNK